MWLLILITTANIAPVAMYNSQERCDIASSYITASNVRAVCIPADSYMKH